MSAIAIQRRELKRDIIGPLITLVTFLDGTANFVFGGTGVSVQLKLSPTEVGKLCEMFSESGVAATKCELAAIAVKEMEAAK